MMGYLDTGLPNFFFSFMFNLNFIRCVDSRTLEWGLEVIMVIEDL